MTWELWVMVAGWVIGIPIAYHMGKVVGGEEEIDRQALEREAAIRAEGEKAMERVRNPRAAG